MMKQRSLILTATFLALLAAPAANAQQVAFGMVDGPYPQARLLRVDLDTGMTVPVGPIGHRATHIAFDTGEDLFAVDPWYDHLLAIDKRTGSGAPVGTLGVDITEVTGLSFDDQNRLWMAARDDVLGPSMFEVDIDSGQATWRFGIAEEYLGGLAVSDTSMFLASNSLATVDTSTGTVTQVAGSEFGIWWARALDNDAQGRLWGLMVCGPCATPWDVLTISEIDITTGTLVDDGLGEPHGTWALAILDSGLFFDGFELGDTSAWGAVAPLSEHLVWDPDEGHNE